MTRGQIILPLLHFPRFQGDRSITSSFKGPDHLQGGPAQLAPTFSTSHTINNPDHHVDRPIKQINGLDERRDRA